MTLTTETRAESKTSKILESATILNNASWLSETAAHELRRLQAILRNDSTTAEERQIAENMLQFYREVDSQANSLRSKNNV